MYQWQQRLSMRTQKRICLMQYCGKNCEFLGMNVARFPKNKTPHKAGFRKSLF